MNRRTVGWGLALLATGTAFASGWVGAGFALGPRLGVATFMIVFGLVLLVASFAAAIRRRTARLDGEGGCPVGATCACGHFNFKPRKTCRSCGAATLYPS